MKYLALFAVLIGIAASQLVFPGLFRNKNEKACKDESECAANECCIHGFGAFGKRFLFDNSPSGVCRPKQKEGAFCVPFTRKISIFNTNAHFAMCPCEDGLECTSDKTVNQHPFFGSVESHTNTMCSKPEEEGSGDM